ncbi:MDR family MFS transporter [Bacillus sp. EB600]|uniref:MDR family MFS transporter n=1 Tax=Bacillus sp. EB600 TaxID=2806345 RepID=UPI00210EB4DA|nr:MDR family MFS transporter [Bacillus sp. EB600]MCQ6279551.1 MFS transporter [Bacillus sp. EB600]
MTQIKNNQGFVVAGLLLSLLMASMDNTIVATAMGTIIGDLGGLDKFIWVTSAYMVAEMAGMPIFGKLSDMFGRKRFFIMGLALFMFGSILCGTAQSIEQLSVYRAIQGIGGGALVPITFTVLFDIFPPEKRGKMTGLFGAVFGLSSIFGPLLGAYITDNISWHWIFYINLPLGIIALFFISQFYKESLEHHKQKIDWLGAFTLVGAVVCLMFALELGGNEYAWNSGVILNLFAGFAVLFLTFLLAEKKASDPVISFTMFKDRLYASSTIVGLLYGIAFIVGSIYIPIFIQGVTGGTATNSGLILLPMMLGVVVSAQTGAMSAARFGYRNIMLVFAVIFLIGIYLLSTVSASTSRTTITLYMIIIGLGTGASFSVLNMSAIHNFGPERRGSANSTLSFVRQLGMTVGITIYGIIQRNVFSDKLKESFGGAGQLFPGGNQSDPRALLSEQARSQIPKPILDKIIDNLANSISYTFTWALIPAILVLVFVFFLTNDRLSSNEKGKKEVAAESLNPQ